MTTEQIVFKLDKPFTVDGQTFTEFTFREPTGEDQIQAEKMETTAFTRTLAMLAITSNTHINVFKKLPLSVLNKINEETLDFFY